MRYLFARPSLGSARPWWQWSWLLLVLLILLLGISIWMLLPSAPLQSWHKPGPVTGVAFSPNGDVLAVPNNRGSTDQLLDINTYTLAVSPDGQTLAAGQEDGVIRLGRVADWQLLRILEGHSKLVEGVIFSPDGSLLASTSWDLTTRVWRVSDGQLLMTRNQPGGSISFSPDGQLLAVGWDPILLIRVSDGSEVRRFDYTGVAQFSPDGQSLLIKATDDAGQNSIHMIRLSDGQQVFHWEGKHAHSYNIAISPDGELIAIADMPPGPGMLSLLPRWGRIELWRVRDGRRVQVLQGHERGVHSVTFSADGQYLASGGHDGTVGLWRVAPRDPHWVWVLLGGSGVVLVALAVLTGMWLRARWGSK